MKRFGDQHSPNPTYSQPPIPPDNKKQITRPTNKAQSTKQNNNK